MGDVTVLSTITPSLRLAPVESEAHPTAHHREVLLDDRVDVPTGDCAAGLSQEELASRAGLTAEAIGALERGERKRPHTVRSLADALGLAGDGETLGYAIVQRGYAATFRGAFPLPASTRSPNGSRVWGYGPAENRVQDLPDES